VQALPPLEIKGQALPPREISVQALPPRDIKGQALPPREIKVQALPPRDIKGKAREISVQALPPRDIKGKPREIKLQALPPLEIKVQALLPREISGVSPNLKRTREARDSRNPDPRAQQYSGLGVGAPAALTRARRTLPSLPLSRASVWNMCRRHCGHLRTRARASGHRSRAAGQAA
jgi:hypothetical protein